MEKGYRMKKGSSVEIDELNVNIIRHLKDGGKSFGAIAQALSITENTVRARVKKMKEMGILSITGLVNPTKIPSLSIAIVGVKLKTMNLVMKGEEISKLKGVVSVAVTTGRYDLIMTVMLNEGFGLLEFYTHEMSKVSEVLATETFIAYTSINLGLPYVL
jgi:Lrp/AsnC family transcriptional regulator, regulator for asnA, asnC and gidA